MQSALLKSSGPVHVVERTQFLHSPAKGPRRAECRHSADAGLATLTVPRTGLIYWLVPRGAPGGAESPLQAIACRRGDPSNLIRIMPAKGRECRKAPWPERA